ncbi:MAG: DNA mismatch repair protein MutS [Clostridium sp.]|nr:DNA mismatch repair protein MutS [Clostridium sp.]
MAKKIVETPLMKQYLEMKRKHPDAVLLFRVGDFYETFSDDAITASEILGITLTRRANGAAQSVELAGFPHHALDTYLPKLVRAGKRVAICEQLEDPKLTKKLVKRGITELVTPGVSINDNILNHRENNFLAAVHPSKTSTGVAFLDISTGEFLVAEGDPGYIVKLMENFAPKEVLIERGTKQRFTADFGGGTNCLTSELDDWVFTSQTARERLLRQFETGSLKGFGIEDLDAAVIAAGAVLHYLDITQHTRLGHISSVSRIEEDRYVRLDRFTVRNLELVNPLGEGGKSLLGIIDRTLTPMGARMLHRWLLFPLKDVAAVNERLDAVDYLFRSPEMREALSSLLEHIGDLERLVGKVSVGRVTPREMLQLGSSLKALPMVRNLVANPEFAPDDFPLPDSLRRLGESIDGCAAIADRIERVIDSDAPANVAKGMVIRSGVDDELDQLRDIAVSGKDYLMKIQARESAATGIPSLKVGYNNVFGYYIEVTNTHRAKVPGEWVRKQTLVNAERYITQELKEFEEKILGAQEKIAVIETRIYNDLIAAVGAYAETVLRDAATIATIDCLNSFASVSDDYGYCHPAVDDSLAVDIKGGRHPVIERQLPPGEPYIANDVSLDNDSTQIMMITGPNMSGKSALLRQTALIVILAQTGCFVPARQARIGVVDKIFTRVGASDNISLGESTFMVEMNEAASILNNMSRRSLILFDELGRGTSTYDGISIAWSIVEYIHNFGDLRPKTLFATHYHELNEMEGRFDRIVNFNVSVRELDGKVVFLRRLARGGSEHSFGIHVAKLAGMPRQIISRANEVLHHLEESNRSDDGADRTKRSVAAMDIPDGMQLTLFQLDDPVLSQIRDEILHLDIDNLTPVAALNKLNAIRTILTGK